MTLTEFLLARIAEDEAVALAASEVTEWDATTRVHVPIPSEPATWTAGDEYDSGAVERTNGHPREVGIVVYNEGSPNEAEAAHIARHDPARVLNECAAKRAVVESLTNLAARGPVDEWNAGDEALWAFLRISAAPYADHPKYQVEWRP